MRPVGPPDRLAVNELLQLQREVKRLSERLSRAPGAGPVAVEWTPKVDVFRCRGSLTVIAEVPGLDPDDIHIICRETTLVIQGERATTRPDDGSAFVCMERPDGRFSRTVSLGAAVDRRKAKASVDTGLLTVSLPLLDDRRGEDVRIPISNTEVT